MTDPPAPRTRASTGNKPSSLWRRLAALLYDLVAVVAIVMVVGMIAEAATLGRVIQTGEHTVVPWWYQLLQYLVVVAYFVASWLRGGQTLGMRPWRMHLRTETGASLDLRAALWRAGIVSLPLLTLAFGYALGPRVAILTPLALWAISFAAVPFDPRRRTLHDMLAGTEVAHATAPPRAGKKP